jgi:hypothetical protein
LAAWVTNAVKHSFDADLEKLRGDLRAEAQKRESLSNGALANMTALQAANAERRVQAADALWKAVEEWNGLSWTVSQMSIVKFEEVSKSIESEPKLQQFFQTIGANLKPDALAIGRGANAARPYLSDLSWALFEAYQGVFIGAAVKLLALKQGIDAREFINVAATNDMLKKALPEQSAHIEKFGDLTHPDMLSLLRARILAEIRSTIEGKVQDADSIARAHEILKLSDAVQKSAEQQRLQKPPRRI